ncbi:putative Cytochrome P450 [Melia azedarach]|uniref:Cytochrome P450 n=1 Tax=Melia azedarach TaxID=155640 RepID=A0ACC1YCU6_MELAZ|nr:putative Cytochrome P450 [Melia azedarach]
MQISAMESLFIILVSISVAALLKAFIDLFFRNKKSQNLLPPGPFTFPVIGNLQWLLKPSSEIEPILRNLHAKLGPIVALRIGSRTLIFVADHSLAYKALVQNGAVFANRPLALPINQITSSNQHNISSSFYGPTWRVLRRNLTAEIMHPSRIKSYNHARKWVLRILLDRFKSQSKNGDAVSVMHLFQYAMFCLLVLMCFGDKLDQKQIEEIEDVQRRRLLGLGKLRILNLWPRLTKVVLRKKWKRFFQLLKDQEKVLVPLIRARQRVKEERLNKAKEDDSEYVLSYVDTLLGLHLPEEKRKLTEQEIINLCSEFLNAGTDTTSTALQWIMANLVKYPDIQEKLLIEIKGVVEDGEEEVKEEELQKMPYLKAVILEGLRRHPPAHFVLPHAVTEDFKLEGYVIPKNASINFMIAEMGWDKNVWKDPMAFKPERFLSEENGVEGFDITGSREIKMMPFGVGRRICPGLGLAMLHLEYFVANLVWSFEWNAMDGDEVDLSEKQEFTIVMKDPLKAHISPRIR